VYPAATLFSGLYVVEIRLFVDSPVKLRIPFGCGSPTGNKHEGPFGGRPFRLDMENSDICILNRDIDFFTPREIPILPRNTGGFPNRSFHRPQLLIRCFEELPRLSFRHLPRLPEPRINGYRGKYLRKRYVYTIICPTSIGFVKITIPKTACQHPV
jgi:hypothetical protein